MFSKFKFHFEKYYVGVFMSRFVRDVLTRGFSHVNESDTLSKCLALFKKEMPPVLAVLDAEGKYKGVIARRWIVRSRLDLSTTKVRTLMKPAPRVAPETSLNEVARLMIESGIRQLPVFEGDKLSGFVTNEDVIHGAVLDKWGNSSIEEVMTEDPVVIEENSSIGAALSLFREHDFSHVPVVKRGRLMGLLSVHDIIEHVFQPRERQTTGEIVGEKVPVLSIPVKGIMSKPVISALPKTKLRDAAKKMHRFDISCLVVVRRDRPVGIVTKLDFLEPIAQMEKPLRRLTVQFSVKDVDMDDVQRGFIMDDFESFARRYGKTLESGTLFVYMKTHGTSYRGDQLIHCRLQFRTVKGSFFSSSEGWGAEQTFRLALDRLEGQILKSKELPFDREFAREYLRRISFPLAEL
jgi:CBS domain-containing protein